MWDPRCSTTIHASSACYGAGFYIILKRFVRSENFPVLNATIIFSGYQQCQLVKATMFQGLSVSSFLWPDVTIDADVRTEKANRPRSLYEFKIRVCCVRRTASVV
jgi:hypothetical protein